MRDVSVCRMSLKKTGQSGGKRKNIFTGGGGHIYKKGKESYVLKRQGGNLPGNCR